MVYAETAEETARATVEMTTRLVARARGVRDVATMLRAVSCARRSCDREAAVDLDSVSWTLPATAATHDSS